jgi:transcriptional regulator GlxA family with amidase domain
MDRRVQAVINLMEENLEKAPSLADMANSLNLSGSHLRHLFRTEVGMSPSHYLKYLRMQRAKDLADSTFLNAKQIMSLLGINDQSHFTRDFKRVHGMTITEYRKRSAIAPRRQMNSK